MKNAIHYRIIPVDPCAHLFAITLTLEMPDPEGQVFQLPAWIPGSYMLREFARNIVEIKAEAIAEVKAPVKTQVKAEVNVDAEVKANPGAQVVVLTKLDKHTWRAAPCAGPLRLQYQVYAWDLSVRTAHLDQNHAFFNSSSVFLRVLGQEQLPHLVDLRRPFGSAYKNWRVATALPELSARRYGFGSYRASNYDELIDHPVEMGQFALATFNAHGVAHDLVISGLIPNLDLERVCGDVQKICASQIALFEPDSRRAPMARYVFLIFVVGEGYGGLEHRASCALLCERNSFPVLDQPKMSDGYRSFLGLCSHEYFHTWNVKRIKPAAFAPYDLQQENYTRLLWWFEGVTSYYDDLILARSGVIDQAAFLASIAKTINSVLRGSGRHKQSVAESSFDAWTKYYRQDENASNAIVSYYTKGSLVALALDLTIRLCSDGKKSLDDVLRLLWQRHGRDFYAIDKGALGVSENELLALFDAATGLKLARTIRRYVHGTADLPLARLLAQVGVEYADQRADTLVGLGMRSVVVGADCKVAAVYVGGVAHLAGLSAGDVLVALDDLRITGANLKDLLARYRPGDSVTLHAFRRDELKTFSMLLKADDAPQVTLKALLKPAVALKRRRAWLDI